MNFKIISAGAGSGKTYRLTGELVKLLTSPGSGVRASGIVATTFTQKAAAELKDRVVVRLLEAGLADAASELSNALIGTVHSLGTNLLKRFAYEAGVSPEVGILADDDQQTMFNQSLAMVLTMERIERIDMLCHRLGLSKKSDYDWRRLLREMTEVARTNGFNRTRLDHSRQFSVSTFVKYLPPADATSRAALHDDLVPILTETIASLKTSGDETKVTQSAILDLEGMRYEMENRGELFWHYWVKMTKTKTSVKSKHLLEPLQKYLANHESCPDFHSDIADFIEQMFDIAADAIEEYDRYKKMRGLIDFTDMEAIVNLLLDEPQVQQVLGSELDLLLVDEFQDTNPMQLSIFLKLARLVRRSIWVGDPKQSIYGFRGAEPRLMQAIIDLAGGISPENILRNSWRSREDLVSVANAIFTQAFANFPPEQVSLAPERKKADEPDDMTEAVVHWHIQADNEKRRSPGGSWFEDCLAAMLARELARGWVILPKGEKKYRPARAGDVAILCRTNEQCRRMADALHKAGLQAAIARTGLLSTAEARLILACLKFILNRNDSLSVAEILRLALDMPTERIVEYRIDYLEQHTEEFATDRWAEEQPFIRELDALREAVVELSSAETLQLLLDELDLRRIIAAWGRADQRLDNVEVFMRMALEYEDACNRLHTGASLGGFLLWLNSLESRKLDEQASGESPDAVNVLTYHRSKGLEWPIVICHSLESELRDDVWGLAIVPERDEIDLDELLANRWLRYWVNPYADQVQGTALEERLETSPEKLHTTQLALSEEKRLLYVGITRARDYVVFPTRQGKPARWLNRVCTGNSEHEVLDPDIGEIPWVWEGRGIPLRVRSEIFAETLPAAVAPAQQLSFLEPPSGKISHQPLRYDFDHEKLKEKYKTNISFARYGPGLVPTENADKMLIARALKYLLAAFRLEWPAAMQQIVVSDIIGRLDLGEQATEQQLLHTVREFTRFAKANYQPVREYRHYPMRWEYKGRLFEAVFDLVYQAADGGMVLVQHMPAQITDPQMLGKKISEVSDWFYLSRMALQAVFAVERVKTCALFALSETVAEISTGD